MDNLNNRYLCFHLGDEQFALPLLSVREVVAMPETTPVPQTPAHFLGIMNLRGQVISIMDLRSKLGIKASKDGETAVIICDMQPNCVGVVVDAIDAVLAPAPEDISAKPQIESSRSTEYITGVYRKDGRLVLFLDVQKVLGTADVQAINSMRKAA